MKSKWITFLLGITVWIPLLQGQNVVVEGQFLFSGEEEFSFGKYQYPLIESELPIIGEGRSDNEGRFRFQLTLSTPSFIHFKRAQDVYILYLEPGDSLTLKILNRFNIEFAGTRQVENEVFFRLGLQQDFYVEDPLEDCLLAMDTLQADRQALLQAYREKQDTSHADFLKYLQAAIVGNRYDILNRIYYYHVSEQPENPMLAMVSNELLDLPVVDEPRSAAYLNAGIAFIENQLNREKALDPLLKEDRIQQWQRRREIATAWTQNAPQLARQISFIQLAMELWWIESQEDLTHFEESWALVKKEFPTDEVHELLAERYAEKRTEVLMKDVKELSLIDSLGEQQMLSELGSYPLLSILWTDSTVLRKELGRLQSLLSFSMKSQHIVTVYAGKDMALWEKLRPQLPNSMEHLRLTEKDIIRLHTEYEVQKYPIFLLFDASGKVQQVAFAFTQEIYRALAFRRDRPR